jgi:hypothetical protein
MVFQKLTRLAMATAALSLCLLVSACAIGGASNDPFYMPESDTNSQAPGEAFTAEGMNFKKPIPHRPDWKPWEFYYKHCSETDDDKPYYSKTSYSCTAPY